MPFDIDISSLTNSNFARVLDEYVQYIAVLIIYRFEYLILPVIGLLAIMLRPIRLLAPLRWVLLVSVLLFLVVFEMHWYSALTLPIVALILFWDAGRDLWSMVLGARAPKPPSLSQKPPGSREPGSGPYWIALVTVCVAILVIGQARWDLFLILGLIGILTLAAVYARPWHKYVEGAFEKRIHKEPRLQSYFDVFRWFRARQSSAYRPYLAANRMAGSGSSRVAELSKYWVIRLVRRLFPKIWMPVMASHFTLQMIASERRRAWVRWQSALSKTSDQAVPAHLDPEILVHRHRWLALSEALAEGFAFSNNRDATRTPSRLPSWHFASELLFHAVEVQFEVIRDLSAQEHAVDQEDRAEACAHEQQLLLHFSETALGAMERYLDTNAFRYAGLTIAEKFNRYTQTPAENEFGDDDVETLRGHWRPVIALRYQFLQTLRKTLGDIDTGAFQQDLNIHYDAQGMGFVTATMNAIPVEMLYDSGASQVTLPYELAEEIGLDPNNLIFNISAKTANGVAKMAQATLQKFEIAGQVIHDLQVCVARSGGLHVPLLGMDIIKLFTPGHPGAPGEAMEDLLDPAPAFEPGPMVLNEPCPSAASDTEFLARCARDGAEALNLLVAGFGEATPMQMLATEGLMFDPFEQADLRLAEARHTDFVMPEMQSLAQDAVLRALNLRALCVEQELEGLSAGSEIWRDRLETAADLHVYTQSYRLHHLCHLQDSWARQPAREILTC